jgi:hypothetical protein
MACIDTYYKIVYFIFKRGISQRGTPAHPCGRVSTGADAPPCVEKLVIVAKRVDERL